MSQHTDNAAQDLEAAPDERHARWFVSVDELADSDNWLLEIDTPNLYLTCEVVDLAALERASALLDSTLHGRGDGGQRAFVAKTDDVALGYFSRVSVHLLRDNEDFPRCFLVVGPDSRSALRITLYEDDIREFARALAEAMRGYTEGIGGRSEKESVAAFVGGPLDQAKLDYNQINAVASVIPIFSETGNRQFLLMPPLEECTHIWRGESTKEQYQGARYPYERHFMPEGGVVFHSADQGQLDKALQPQPPLSPEAQARKNAFGVFADQFIEQVKRANINENTEVFIVYMCVDETGREVIPERVSVAPTTKVRFPDNKEGAKEFAAVMHLDAIIGNINSLVRNAPTGGRVFPDKPRTPVQILGFRLEIEHPDA